MSNRSSHYGGCCIVVGHLVGYAVRDESNVMTLTMGEMRGVVRDCAAQHVHKPLGSRPGDVGGDRVDELHEGRCTRAAQSSTTLIARLRRSDPRPVRQRFGPPVSRSRRVTLYVVITFS